MASNEEILKGWLDQCFEPGTLHFDTIGKIEEAMEDARKDEGVAFGNWFQKAFGIII